LAFPGFFGLAAVDGWAGKADDDHGDGRIGLEMIHCRKPTIWLKLECFAVRCKRQEAMVRTRAASHA
jgi:hypothetical protein